MSLIFPTLSAPNAAFGWPVRKTPQYRTIVQTPVSGRGELRLAQARYPRWLFELDVAYLTGDFSTGSSAFAALIDFYMAAQGMASDFLFTDPNDNAVAGQNFGIGDGTTTTFQLTRSIAGAGVDIVQNVKGTPTIEVAGTPTTPASIGSTGIVSFSEPPASGAALTWTGNFYFRCRFDDDSQSSLQEDLYQLWSLSGLKFRSVIL